MLVGASVSVGSGVGVLVGAGVLVGSGVGVLVGATVLVGSGVGALVGVGVRDATSCASLSSTRSSGVGVAVTTTTTGSGWMQAAMSIAARDAATANAGNRPISGVGHYG